MTDFDFSPKVNPMQGVSLADMVKAQTPAFTSILQSVPSMAQALQQRRQQMQRNQLMSQVAQGDPQTQALLQLGIMPPQFRFRPPETPQHAEQMSSARARGSEEGRGLTAGDISENVKQMKNGLPVSLIGGRGTQRAKLIAEYSRHMAQNPRLLPPQQLEVMFRSEAQRARTLNSQQTQNDLVSIDQFNSALDQAVEAARKIPRSSFVPLNKLIQNFANNVYASDSLEAVAASQLQALQAEIGLQGSRVFSSSAPTDIRFKAELNRFPAAGSMEQLEAVVDTLKQLANVRKNGILNFPTLYPVETGLPNLPIPRIPGKSIPTQKPVTGPRNVDGVAQQFGF